MKPFEEVVALETVTKAAYKADPDIVEQCLIEGLKRLYKTGMGPGSIILIRDMKLNTEEKKTLAKKFKFVKREGGRAYS